jgi:hypothetical protein
MTRGSGRAYEGASSIAEAVSGDDNDDEEEDDEDEDDDAFSGSVDSDDEDLQRYKSSKRQRGSLNQEFSKARGGTQGISRHGVPLQQQSSSRQQQISIINEHP